MSFFHASTAGLTPDALHEARETAATMTLAYAQWIREASDETLALMDVVASGVETLLPDRQTATSLGFGYSAQTALTELNGARVRILDAVDEVETIPDGTDPTNFAPLDSIDHDRAALVAAYDLMIKIRGFEASAPTEWESTKAEIKEGAAEAGDLVGGVVGKFAEKLVANVWWVVAALAIVFFFVYVKGPKVPVAA